MAGAHKCDRCGKLFEDFGPHKDLEFKDCPGKGFTQLFFRNRNFEASYAKDLCYDCAHDFIIWWEHSNISAWSELERIKAQAQLVKQATSNDSANANYAPVHNDIPQF